MSNIPSNLRISDSELAGEIANLERLRLNPAGLSTREAYVLLALYDLSNRRAFSTDGSADEMRDDAADAARWRALIGCARITAIGSAGLGEKPQPNNYAHLSINLWTVHDSPGEPYAVEWLQKFADIAVRAKAAEKP